MKNASTSYTRMFVCHLRKPVRHHLKEMVFISSTRCRLYSPRENQSVIQIIKQIIIIRSIEMPYDWNANMPYISQVEL